MVGCQQRLIHRQIITQFYARFNRKELSTTDNDENAIAAAAKIGLRRTPKKGYKAPAATGIKATL